MPRRPRKNKHQRTIDDIVLENPELEDALIAVTSNEQASTAYRKARTAVKKLIQTQHPEIINSVIETGEPRFAVVGNQRFAYQTAIRPAGTSKETAEGVSTKLEVYTVEGA